MEKNYMKIIGSAIFLFLLLNAGISFAQSKREKLKERHEGTLFGAILNLFPGDEVKKPERLITGRIESEGFSGLPYVRLDNSEYASVVNYDGDFIISVPEDEQILVIGAPGLMEQVINLDEATSYYHIRLRVEGGKTTRNEPAIFGMKINPRSYNGAYTTLTARDIMTRNSSTLDEVLVGSVPGLTAAGSWKGVATNFRFTIRGRGSLMSSTAPLVVLDGAPYSGALNTINPNDVQYLTVLRDAAGKAAYGSRGANGIILITTKRGGDNYME